MLWPSHYMGLSFGLARGKRGMTFPEVSLLVFFCNLFEKGGN